MSCYGSGMGEHRSYVDGVCLGMDTIFEEIMLGSSMVSRFCVRPTSKRWFLRIVQVTMKHDPFDVM